MHKKLNVNNIQHLECGIWHTLTLLSTPAASDGGTVASSVWTPVVNLRKCKQSKQIISFELVNEQNNVIVNECITRDACKFDV